MKLAMPFDNPTTYKGHTGIDFPKPNGTPIRATGHGVVGLLSKTASGGFVTWIDYDELPKGLGIGYAHQNGHSIKKGTRVAPGDVIGYVGYSGRVVPSGPAGAHLHIEVAGRPGDAAVWELFDRSRAWDGGTSPAAPAFPLPNGWYFGPQDGPEASVSGYHGNRENLRRWQQRMADRGWGINPDGFYGDQTRDVARAFQTEKGLTVDGKIGPVTWAAAWTAPVT